jgi:hypothetical protein
MFIEVSARMCMSIYVCTVFKKISGDVFITFLTTWHTKPTRNCFCTYKSQTARTETHTKMVNYSQSYETKTTSQYRLETNYCVHPRGSWEIPFGVLVAS